MIQDAKNLDDLMRNHHDCRPKMDDLMTVCLMKI
jgi:hypothetical protein